uniref:Tetratricopeptide repeat domain 23 n=1 Tax=Cyprinus carpio TaxID=7962 RepID=A0A8C2L092_CYPCA
MSSSTSSGESLQETDSTVISQKADVKNYSMMTPAEKLSLCERRAQSLADSEEYDPCIQELVRCLALSRLVYGNEHFAVAQAQSRLAKAYLQHKGRIFNYLINNENNELESISVYRSALGPQDKLTLSAQDDFSHFLLLTGQQERCAEIQRESLAYKKSTFGELSAEVAEALQLIGGVEMTQGQMRHSHRTLKKCLDIQNMLYGPQHKKTKATQRTVDMLSQSPEVSEGHKEIRLETRPAFCAVVSSASEVTSSMSNS